MTLRRIPTASRRYRDGLSPFAIISGGDSAHPSARQPADFMVKFAGELGIPSTVILLEKASENARASAVNVYTIYWQRRIKRVLPVTNSVHMRRAVSAFRAQHLFVSLAPVDPWALHWETPDLRLGKFWGAPHEYAGLHYYWCRGWI